MAEDILITCHSISFADGYPVLRKVFRHLAVTPESYVIWIEPIRLGVVHLLLQYSNGVIDQIADIELLGGGQDFTTVVAPAGFEGGVEIIMIDAETGNARSLRRAHFGGMG
ncbi:MAG: hypothetical protein H6841_09185 [Planctomycetes bacterium]|nr:hypothetical protein [Planctomycetota bacterium]